MLTDEVRAKFEEVRSAEKGTSGFVNFDSTDERNSGGFLKALELQKVTGGDKRDSASLARAERVN